MKERGFYKASETDLAYLAGLIDSDGYITIAKYEHVRKDRPKAYVRCIPRVGVVSHFQEVIDFLRQMGFSVHKHGNSRNSSIISKLQVWEATILGLRPVKDLLEKVMPYLKGKRKRAELVLKFIESRLKREPIIKTVKFKDGRIVERAFKPYTEEELRIVELVKSLR